MEEEYEERPYEGILKVVGDNDEDQPHYFVLDMNPTDTYEWMREDERMFLVVTPLRVPYRLIVRGAYTLAELPGIVKVRIVEEKE